MKGSVSTDHTQCNCNGYDAIGISMVRDSHDAFSLCN